MSANADLHHSFPSVGDKFSDIDKAGTLEERACSSAGVALELQCTRITHAYLSICLELTQGTRRTSAYTGTLSGVDPIYSAFALSATPAEI